MLGFKGILLWLLLLVGKNIPSTAQDIDSAIESKKDLLWQHFIVPSLGIGYGVSAQFINPLDRFDNYLQSNIRYRNRPFKMDDYIQYFPVAAVYGLDWLGVKAKNNFIDRSIMLGLSGLIVAPSVHLIKEHAGILRPDGSTYNSFPSGHTATAFVAATFMWLEYKDIHPLLAHSGFVLATSTGILRMYNNRHWFSDVVMGGSIGFLSTYLVYQMYPHLKRFVLGNKQDQNLNWMCLPQVQQQYFGLQFKYVFQ